jgi:hypothetical protein
MEMGLLPEPRTARGFLFGEGWDGVTALAQALQRQRALSLLGPALRGVSRSGLAGVTGEVAAAIHGLLDLDLGDLVIAGWRKYGALTAAARRTRDTPGTSEIVDLATHTITSVHQPEVDLLVREVRVATIHVDLSAEFTLHGLAATVRGGELVGLEGGSCDITASLSVESMQVASQTGHTQAPAVVHLGNGVPLLPRGQSDAVRIPTATETATRDHRGDAA